MLGLYRKTRLKMLRQLAETVKAICCVFNFNMIKSWSTGYIRQITYARSLIWIPSSLYARMMFGGMTTSKGSQSRGLCQVRKCITRLESLIENSRNISSILIWFDLSLNLKLDSTQNLNFRVWNSNFLVCPGLNRLKLKIIMYLFNFPALSSFFDF